MTNFLIFKAQQINLKVFIQENNTFYSNKDDAASEQESLMNIQLDDQNNKTLFKKEDQYSQEIFELRLKEIQAIEQFKYISRVEISSSTNDKIDLKILLSILSNTFLKELEIAQKRCGRNFISQIAKFDNLQILKIHFEDQRNFESNLSNCKEGEELEEEDVIMSFQQLQLKELSLERVPECLKIFKWYPNVIKAHLLFEELNENLDNNFFSSFLLLEKLELIVLKQFKILKVNNIESENLGELNPQNINLSPLVNLKSLQFLYENSMAILSLSEFPSNLRSVILINNQKSNRIFNDKTNEYFGNETYQKKLQFNLQQLKYLKLDCDDQESKIIDDLNIMIQSIANLEEFEINITQIQEASDELMSCLCQLLEKCLNTKIRYNMCNQSFNTKQKLEMALAVRRMKFPKMFEWNFQNRFDGSIFNVKSQKSFISLGVYGVQKEIYSQLFSLDEEVKEFQQITSKDEIEKVKQLLNPFKKINISLWLIQRTRMRTNLFQFAKEGQYGMQQQLENSILKVNCEYQSFETILQKQNTNIFIKNTETQYLELPLDTQSIFELIPLLTFLSTDLIELSVMCDLSFLQIEELANYYQNLIQVSLFSFIIDQNQAKSSVPKRNLLLSMKLKQIRDLFNIIYIRGHFIDIYLEENTSMPFEESIKMFKQILNLEGKILIQSKSDPIFRRKSKFDCLNKHRQMMKQQILISKVYFDLIADYLPINPQMVFSEIYF